MCQSSTWQYTHGSTHARRVHRTHAWKVHGSAPLLHGSTPVFHVISTRWSHSMSLGRASCRVQIMTWLLWPLRLCRSCIKHGQKKLTQLHSHRPPLLYVTSLPGPTHLLVPLPPVRPLAFPGAVRRYSCTAGTACSFTRSTVPYLDISPISGTAHTTVEGLPMDGAAAICCRAFCRCSGAPRLHPCRYQPEGQLYHDGQGVWLIVDIPPEHNCTATVLPSCYSAHAAVHSHASKPWHQGLCHCPSGRPIYTFLPWHAVDHARLNVVLSG
mmetsp:Transcript_31109/g.69112  ORF Transcript_31109/g.69112 Transcript_31109/m.69112 type:complete len:269 (-) Transcript_31109:807-1613(-)